MEKKYSESAVVAKRRRLNTSHKVNTQNTTVKRCLNDILKLTESIFVKNPCAYFALKISADQRFGTYVCIPMMFVN